MAGNKQSARARRHIRIRKKILGTLDRPRLCIYRSMRHFYAQLIDDVLRRTLIGFSTLSKEFPHSKDASNTKGAKELGKIFARKALDQNVRQVVFDRGGFLYHGRVKAFAEGAREGGLKF